MKIETKPKVRPVSPSKKAKEVAPALSSPTKVLYIVQLPPPLHGVSAMNKVVVESPVINKQFTTRIVPLRFSEDLTQLQKFSFSKLLQFINYGFAIFQIMVLFRPRLVYFTLTPTTMAFFRDAFYVAILKLFRAKIVFHLHGKGIRKTVAGSNFKRRIYAMVFKNTHVICLSNTLTADIDAIYKAKPSIVHNGIELKPALKNGKEKVKNDVPQLLYLSNYTETKGALILLRALAILKRKGYRFNARFVGAPYDLSIEMLNNIIRENDLTDSAEIVGPRYGNDKDNEFRNADIFVHPTYNDAFPLVSLEAMQFSLPVVTTLEGGNPDIVVEGETGFLVETRNPPMLAERIAVLLENEELRRKMGRKGYERFIRNFTLERFEQNLKDALTTILRAN